MQFRTLDEFYDRFGPDVYISGMARSATTFVSGAYYKYLKYQKGIEKYFLGEVFTPGCIIKLQNNKPVWISHKFALPAQTDRWDARVWGGDYLNKEVLDYILENNMLKDCFMKIFTLQNKINQIAYSNFTEKLNKILKPINLVRKDEVRRIISYFYMFETSKPHYYTSTFSGKITRKKFTISLEKLVLTLFRAEVTWATLSQLQKEGHDIVYAEDILFKDLYPKKFPSMPMIFINKNEIYKNDIENYEEVKNIIIDFMSKSPYLKFVDEELIEIC